MKVRGRLNRTLSVTVPNNGRMASSQQRQAADEGTSRHQRDFLFEFDHDTIPNDRPVPRDGIVLTSSAQVPSPGAEKRFSSGGNSQAAVAFPAAAHHQYTSSGKPSLPLPKLGLSSPWFNAGKPDFFRSAILLP